MTNRDPDGQTAERIMYIKIQVEKLLYWEVGVSELVAAIVKDTYDAIQNHSDPVSAATMVLANTLKDMRGAGRATDLN